MSDSSILVNEPTGATADAEIDAEQISASGPQEGKPLRRERVQIGGDALDKVAVVSDEDPASDDMALAVRNIPSGTPQPVSAATLPLPEGAATEAKQDTGNNSLSSINAKLPATADADPATDADAVVVRPAGPLPPVEATGTIDTDSGAGSEVVLEIRGRPYVCITFQDATAFDGQVLAYFSMDGGLTWDERYSFDGDNNSPGEILPHPEDPVRTWDLYMSPAVTHVKLVCLNHNSGELDVRIVANETYPTVLLERLAFQMNPVTLGALNDKIECPVGYRMSVGFVIKAGTLAARINVQYSPDAFGDSSWADTVFFVGTTWYLNGVRHLDLTNPNAQTTLDIPLIAGAQRVRLTVSNYTSGNAVATARTSNAQAGLLYLLTAGFEGQPPPFFAQVMAGWDGTSTRKLVVKNSHPSTTDYGAVVRQAKRDLLFAVIDENASGDQQIVAADGSKKIKVISYVLVAAGAVSVKWRSAANDRSGAMPLAANGGVASPSAAPGDHLLETAVNEALNLNLSGNVQVSGHVAYILEA